MTRRRALVAAGLAAAAMLGACTSDSGVTSQHAVARPGTARTTLPPDTPPTTAPSTSAPETSAPETSAPATTLPGTGEPIPSDPDVRILTLGNGLTVYMRHNERPGFHAQIRLAIDAGSGSEEADQSGVAHFLEHMLFNGTQKFPRNELVATLRTFGMELGPDINAYTSFDETVYELSVPLTDPANLGTGLDVAAEWLSAATLADDEVVNERGVVLDEWRPTQGFDGRVGTTIEEMFLTGTAYEGRDPIGLESAIEAMTPEPLRRFYDRWYRPDNAALVIVGDVEVDAVEAAVRTRFEGIVPRGGDGPPQPAVLDPYDAPLGRVLVDPDATEATFELTLPATYPSDRDSFAARREELLTGLAFSMIATRLGDDVARGTAPFTQAYPSDNSMVRALDAPSIVVSGEPSGHIESVDALIAEFERVRRFGFDATEVTRAADRLRAAAESDYDRRDTSLDVSFTDRYVAHFLQGTPIPSADVERDLLLDVLATTTADDVAATFVRHWEAGAPYLMGILPDDLADLPTDETLRQKLLTMADLALEAREPVTGPSGGLMTPPDPVDETGRVSLAQDEFSFVAPVQLTFANGAKVVLNATPIVDETVAFAALSPGGLSVVPDGDVPTALVVTDVVTSSGIGELDAVQLDTLLASTSAQLTPYLAPAEEGFSGAASTDDLETLFQLLHLYFEAPRFDDVGLVSVLASLRPIVSDPSTDPDLSTYLAFVDARYGAEPRFEPFPTLAEMDAIDVAAVERVWRSRFSNASDWTFAISGDFELEEVAELAREYIGTMTGSGVTEQFVDVQVDPPPGVAESTVNAGTGDQGTLTVVFSAPAQAPANDAVLCDLLSTALSNLLTDHIREELGASYSPFAFCALEREPDLLLQTVIQVTGDPDGLIELATVLQADLESLRVDGATDVVFSDAVADITDQYDLFRNEQLLEELVRAPAHPDELDEFIARRETLQDVDVAAFNAWLPTALPAGQYISILTLPS